MTHAGESADAALKRVLAELSQKEREALYQSYCLGRTGEQVSKDLGLAAKDLRKLKSSVKAAFSSARRA